jgi:hypothetical protein
MDDDPVLSALDAYLEHDDPALAALLSGRRRHRHPAAWLLLPLLIPALLIPALLLPARVTLGVLAMLLVLSSPVLVAWLCAGNPEPPDAPA